MARVIARLVVFFVTANTSATQLNLCSARAQWIQRTGATTTRAIAHENNNGNNDKTRHKSFLFLRPTKSKAWLFLPSRKFYTQTGIKRKRTGNEPVQCHTRCTLRLSGERESAHFKHFRPPSLNHLFNEYIPSLYLLEGSIVSQ